jgi:hypothetical protein
VSPRASLGDPEEEDPAEDWMTLEAQVGWSLAWAIARPGVSDKTTMARPRPFLGRSANNVGMDNLLRATITGMARARLQQPCSWSSTSLRGVEVVRCSQSEAPSSVPASRAAGKGLSRIWR